MDGMRTSMVQSDFSQLMKRDRVAPKVTFRRSFRSVRPSKWNLDLGLLCLPVGFLWLVSRDTSLMSPGPVALVIGAVGLIVLVVCEFGQSLLQRYLRVAFGRIEKELGSWMAVDVQNHVSESETKAYHHTIIYRAQPWFNRPSRTPVQRQSQRRQRYARETKMKGDT